jgi:hypothetical protein
MERRGAVMGVRLSLGVLLAAWVAPAPVAGSDLFASRVAPLLRQRCLSCHDGHKRRGGLDLSARAGLLAGGDSGPAAVPGKASASLLLAKVRGPAAAMPRQGPKLTAGEIDALARWIDAGAPWPRGVVLAAERRRPGGDWWSLRPLVRPAVPAVRDTGWVRTPVDAFVLARLEAAGLRPSPQADRRTLIRRVTFDLHGLPPTPQEIDAFVADTRPDAYEILVDRLLASPRYGERWGRHWLDVVHYGDTHGYDKDKRRDHAWPYRDYVIAAFNNDKPYPRFILEQIAGDVLWPGEAQAVIATGFVTAGPWDFVGHVELREGTVDKEKTRLLDRDDMVTTAIGTFNSLTVGCARCHDHKFDPIPVRDYYRLQAVFAGVERGERSLPPHLPRVPRWLTYAVVPVAPRPVWVLHRGNVEDRREPVRPGALGCVPGPDPDFRLTDPDKEGDRRAALARWVADPRNPLTWRSVVNRAWHYHFGRGLVDTPNDFGRNGSPPSHPELLDWLAVAFRDGGGSFKKLHCLIVLSAAYRQASAHRPDCAAVDADNRLLWRANRVRLDAEELRDAVLAVSGKLDLRMGGPGFELFRFKDDHSPVYDHTALEKMHDPATYRRTVYRFTVRSVPNPFLECLDCADPNLNVPVRSTTLTALQALALLNDPFMVRQAEYFAGRLAAMAADVEGQLEAAYRLALGRPPLAGERAALAEYARRHGLAAACRLLFNTNEFVFID